MAVRMWGRRMRDLASLAQMRRSALVLGVPVIAAVVAAASLTSIAYRHPPSVVRRVELVGCSGVSAAHGCEAAVGAQLYVSVDGEPVRGLRARSVPTGARCEPEKVSESAASARETDLRLEHVPGVLCVTGRAADGDLAVRVAVAEDSRPDWLHAALALRAQGHVEGAERIARDHANDSDAGDAARAESLLARLALSRGDATAAAARLARTVDLHMQAGRWSDEANDRFALAHTLAGYVRDIEGAERALDAEVFDRFPEARARALYYRAVVAHHAGRPRDALGQARRAANALRALRLQADADDADGLVALASLRLGLSCEARERFLAIEARAGNDAPSCARVDRLTSASTATLRASEDGDCDGSSPAEAGRLARRAIELTDAACPGGLRRATANLALAGAELARGDPRAARGALDRAQADVASPTHWLRLGYHEVAASVALDSGDPVAAAEHARAALGLATSAAERWLASVYLARALRARGDTMGALSAYGVAEDALDALAVLVPLGEGRAIAAATRVASSEEPAVLLLGRREPARAFAVLRRARARVLRSTLALRGLGALPPSERARVDAELARHNRLRTEIEQSVSATWAVPNDERAPRQTELADREREALAALDRALSVANDHARRGDGDERERPDVLDLLVAAIGGTWHVLARGAGGVRDLELGVSLDADAWQTRVLPPLRPDIERAQRVRVLATGRAQDVAVHTLLLDGAWLCERVEVVYGLDVPTAAPAPSGARGLLVTDPSGNLPGARREEPSARAFFERRGGELRTFRQADATRRAVVEELPHADAFVFAGHASFGGHDGVSAGLRLAGDARLELGDVLALPHAPSLVVLSSCEGAKTEKTSVPALGIAQAFVARGAALVIAPREVVSDDGASAFARALYDSDASVVRTCTLARARGLDARTVGAFVALVP
jgi:tetratricopeptide (TPR) repeat protein